MPRLILGCDAAWGGWGWCLATEAGPLDVGHVVLGSRAWRTAALREYLVGLERQLAGVELEVLGMHDPRPRLVVEEVPHVYKRGNQASTAGGVMRLVGALELHFCRRDLAYPAAVNPRTWRAWWGVAGRGRAEKKASAIRIVRHRGWGGFLDPHPDPGPARDHGARGDVAEAILIAVGAAGRPAELPRGPAAWR